MLPVIAGLVPAIHFSERPERADRPHARQRWLTSIVGPNGCGKSHLLETLRWVMGESSHK